MLECCVDGQEPASPSMRVVHGKQPHVDAKQPTTEMIPSSAIQFEAIAPFPTALSSNASKGHELDRHGSFRDRCIH